MKRSIKYRFNTGDNRWEYWDNGGWVASKPMRGLSEDGGARMAATLGIVVPFAGTEEQLQRRYS